MPAQRKAQTSPHQPARMAAPAPAERPSAPCGLPRPWKQGAQWLQASPGAADPQKPRTGAPRLQREQPPDQPAARTAPRAEQQRQPAQQRTVCLPAGKPLAGKRNAPCAPPPPLRQRDRPMPGQVWPADPPRTLRLRTPGTQQAAQRQRLPAHRQLRLQNPEPPGAWGPVTPPPARRQRQTSQALRHAPPWQCPPRQPPRPQAGPHRSARHLPRAEPVLPAAHHHLPDDCVVSAMPQARQDVPDHLVRAPMQHQHRNGRADAAHDSGQ